MGVLVPIRDPGLAVAPRRLGTMALRWRAPGADHSEVGKLWSRWRSRKDRVRSYEFRVRMGFNTMLFPISAVAGHPRDRAVPGRHPPMGRLADELERRARAVLSTLRSDLGHGRPPRDGVRHERQRGRPGGSTWRWPPRWSATSQLVAEFDEPEEVRLGAAAIRGLGGRPTRGRRVFAAPSGERLAVALDAAAASLRAGRATHQRARRRQPSRAAGRRPTPRPAPADPSWRWR